MAKRWVIKSYPDTRPELHGSFLVSQLLYNRGVRTREEAESFLDPKYERMHNPFLFKDMEKAVDRLLIAIEKKQKITVYGDYDADAVTANAVLCRTFQKLGADFDFYIPDRFTEGYGVNLDAIKKILDNGSKVVVTVDCGTNSVDVADFCVANGMDFIVTDHHEIIGQTPQAFALINPKNHDDTYPYRDITGVGVAFKLAYALLQNPRSKKLNSELVEGWEKWLLDLVAIGTVADCHSLLGENRILVKYGLKVLARTKWSGLRALCESAGIDFKRKALDTYTLGFVLAPRINAAGRLEHAKTALELLLEDDWKKAYEMALVLESINQRRQALTERMVGEAKERSLLISERKVLALMSEESQWHKGVVGLVAGRLAESFYKPTIVLSLEGGMATGSARTAGDFNMVEALKYASEHLERFGGHKQAAGLSLRPENFEGFYLKILEYAEASQNVSEVGPELVLEAELSPEDLNWKVSGEIARLEPFGVENPKPVFALKAATLVSFRVVGQEGKHLQMNIRSGNEVFPAIGFGLGSMQAMLSSGMLIDIACELMEDEWMGKKQLKLKILDLKKSETFL